MSTAAQPAKAAAPLRVLLVGPKEEDFFLIRDILQRNRSTFAAKLEHATSLADARELLQEQGYGLVLFEHQAGNVEAVRLLSEFLKDGNSPPFVVLTEDADEATVAEIIDNGTWNCVSRSPLDGATLVRTMRSTVALHAAQREQRSAEDSLRKLSRAVEQSADAVMITNRKGVVEYVNPAFEDLTGYDRGHICGKTPRLLKSGQQGREFYEELWQTILSGNVYRGILANRKKTGQVYYTEETITPVRDSRGEITHFISNGRDLTERMRLEAQLQQAQKMDAIGRLAGGVAHDFNNLLTIITSYSELALDAAPQNSPLWNKLQEILQAAHRAATLTRQLLAFSRKQPQALRVVELNTVIDGIAKTLPRLIGEDIKFTFLPGESAGRVRVDPVQIEQILMNLAANARDAMPQGGQLQIETSTAVFDEESMPSKPAVIPAGRYASITVSDDGEGIPAEHLPHIFEPFYTTKPSGAGTGLGLATVYGIVKQNNGFIWAYSELEMGSVFKIYLPWVPGQPEGDELAPTRPLPVARGSETILLVEDEAAVRNVTAEFLGMNGYRVLEAKDGAEALEVTGRQVAPIHLVVTDVVMPNMSGGQLANELLRLRPDAKILFVSGYAGQTVLDHKVFDLETNFLQKPYTLRQLSAKIRAALDSGRSGDQRKPRTVASAV